MTIPIGVVKSSPHTYRFRSTQKWGVQNKRKAEDLPIILPVHHEKIVPPTNNTQHQPPTHSSWFFQTSTILVPTFRFADSSVVCLYKRVIPKSQPFPFTAVVLPKALVRVRRMSSNVVSAIQGPHQTLPHAMYSSVNTQRFTRRSMRLVIIRSDGIPLKRLKHLNDKPENKPKRL